MKKAKFLGNSAFGGEADLLPNGFDKALIDSFFGDGPAHASPKSALLQQPVVDDIIIGDVVIDPDDLAYARPAGKGGGKTDSGSTDGTTTTTKGKGRKDKTPDEPDTDTGGTDTGGTDTGGTDTGGTDTGGTDTGGETNPGSTDPNVYVSGMDNPDGFNMTIEFTGDWTEAMKSVVKDVAEDLSDIILSDLPSYNGVDDFHLLAIANTIDGSGGYLGIGGTLTERPGTFLPSNGFLRIDTSDAYNSADSEIFHDVVFHEMLHALGFGTTWQEQGLVQTINGQTRFTGENATLAYNTLFPEAAASDPGSALGVLLASDGSHWDHSTFTREVMTPSLYPSNNHISDMTIAALEDMGYDTIFDAENYFVA
jgi:hypothetical protein